MPLPIKEYKDVNLDLVPHPLSGDIVPITGVDAVKRSIRNIVLTDIYERPYRPNIGSRVAHLLFEPVDPLTRYCLRDEIYRSVALNESRARIIDIVVKFDDDNNQYVVDISFSVENTTEVFNLGLFLERVR